MINSKVLIHVPHSSMVIPDEYKRTALISRMELNEEIEFMCDTGLIELIPPKFENNALIFPYSRFYCDVERFRDESEPMNAYGMGYIYTHDSRGRRIFRPDKKHIEEIDRLYERHHEELDRRVERILQEHGECILIDFHSFSDETVDRLFGIKDAPDVCIGVEPDYYNDQLVTAIKGMCEAAGLSVMINYPYKGSIVPNAYYGKKNTGIISVMIEINKRILGTPADKKLGHMDSMHWESNAYSQCESIPDIDEIIMKYTNRAKLIKQPNWYVKYAAIYFMYEGESYNLYPGIINASEEVFELLADDIIDDLYRAGAQYMFYSGMLD